MNQPITTREIMHRPAHSGVAASQATTIEQSRAIAQVQGALVVARQNPRDTIAATERMREACQHMALAEHAFFRFPRGGQTISGPSIHMATELARCWGNVDYGISELSRDDIRGESEMLAYAWDLETNNRVTNSFIVPHSRDTKKGKELLTDARDLYENNANMGARRLRECIFRVLPVSFREEAKEIAAKTLQHGAGVSIEKRREKMLEAFSGIGVTRKQVEKKMGRSADKLTAHDIGQLSIIFKSIQRGEISKSEEFPDDAAAELTQEILTTAKAAQEAPQNGNDRQESAPKVSESVGQGKPRQEAEEITPEPSQYAPQPQETAAEGITEDPDQPELIPAETEPQSVSDLPEEQRDLVMELQTKAGAFERRSALSGWFGGECKQAMDKAGLHQIGRDAVAHVVQEKGARLQEVGS